MSGDALAAAFLPMALAAVLVGVALIGHRLAPARRRGAERLFRWGLAATTAALLGWAAVQKFQGGDELAAIAFALIACTAAFVLLTRRRPEDAR